jgi:carbamoyl-phosphate synthase small subunit
MEAILVLEDGTVFRGKYFGGTGEKFDKLVFNTSMTGYQEILTDPSYKGQIVTMTYPLIGNYGVNQEDVESRQPFVEGFIVKECSRISSYWRAKDSLGNYLKKNDILGIQGMDTRALTLHKGTYKALRSNNVNVEIVGKINEGDTHILDLIRKGELKLIINTPSGMSGQSDMKLIRSSEVMHGVPCITTIQCAQAAVNGIESVIRDDFEVKSIQEYLDQESLST